MNSKYNAVAFIRPVSVRLQDQAGSRQVTGYKVMVGTTEFDTYQTLHTAELACESINNNSEPAAVGTVAREVPELQARLPQSAAARLPA